MLDGHAYVVDKSKGSVTYWRCERRSANCGGRLKTEDDVVQGEASSHSHPPDDGHQSSLKTVQKIDDRAELSEEVTSASIQNGTSEYPLDAADALPKNEILARLAPDGDTLTNYLWKSIRGEDLIIHEGTTERQIQPGERDLPLGGMTRSLMAGVDVDELCW